MVAGDGALGFWKALRDVFPETREQRCWFHKIANVLGALPKSAHPGAKKALAEIWNAEDKDKARKAVKAFAAAYGAKFPKAVAKITGDEEELLAFYDYPVGFQNSATSLDLGFYAARSYSLRRPPRTGRRLIRSWERSAAGWSGRGGRSWRLRWGRRPL